MATKKVKKTVKRTVKKATKATNNKNIQNIQVSLNKMKENAMDVNNQVVEMVTEAVKDIRENRAGLKDVANKTVNLAKDTVVEAVDMVTEKVTVENIGKSVKEVNKYTVKTADELVDGVIVNGEKWQKVANKAVKGGLKLAEKQQEIMFDTLEEVKGQFSKSAVRLKKIFFSKN